MIFLLPASFDLKGLARSIQFNLAFQIQTSNRYCENLAAKGNVNELWINASWI